MNSVEALAHGKTLLVLDTASDAAERLYAREGWTRVGVVPDFALLPDGLETAGDQAGIEGIGLGDLALGPGEGTDAGRVDEEAGQVRVEESLAKLAFIAVSYTHLTLPTSDLV